MKDVIYLSAIFTFICTMALFLSFVTPIGYWLYVFGFTLVWYSLETIKKYILNR